MPFPRPLVSIVVLLAGLSLAGLPLAALAQSPSGPTTLDRIQATEALTEQHVRDYLRLRVQTHDLQQQYKANADQYDDVIRAFYAERESLLTARGYTGDAFDRLEERILAAQGAMERQKELDATATERAQEREEMLAMPMLGPEQKAQLRKGFATQDSLEQAALASSRPDWPAVRAHLDALEHLTDYVAGNRPDAPTVE